MALYHLYLGTPAAHTNLLTLLHNALFGEHWDVLGVTTWRDPRWASLSWGLACLTFWTLLTGPVLRQVAALKVPIRLTARIRLTLKDKVNYWDAEHIAGGYLGGGVLIRLFIPDMTLSGHRGGKTNIGLSDCAYCCLFYLQERCLSYSPANLARLLVPSLIVPYIKGGFGW